MPADLFPARFVTDILDPSRALQRATAAATAEGRAVFERLRETRAALGAQIAALQWTAGAPVAV